MHFKDELSIRKWKTMKNELRFYVNVIFGVSRFIHISGNV